MNSRPFTFDRVIRMLIGIAVLVIVFLLVKRLSGVLLPFLIAWLLAYLLQPIVHFFQFKLKFKSRVLSIATVLTLFIGIITGIILLLIPIVSDELQKAANLLVNYSQTVNINDYIPHSWQSSLQYYFSHLNIQKALRDPNIMEAVKKIAPQIWDLFNSSIDFVLGVAVVMVIFLYLVFILLDFDKISSGMFAIIPPKYQKLAGEIIEDMEIGMNRYFRGQALIALIVGVLFIIGFSIIQLPMAILLGLFIGVLTLVPYLKALGLIPAVLLGVLQAAETGQRFSAVLIGIAIVFIAIQVLEDFILTPKIMGKVTGLNPAVIMLSLSIWGSLMGIVGMIIALPLTTLIISYYGRFVLGMTEESETENTTPVAAEKINQPEN